MKQGEVLCVTPHTAVDHVIEIDAFTAGTTFRAMSSNFFPAGKGINAAVGVATLGHQSKATGFVGELNKDLFKMLNDDRVQTSFIVVPGRTRTNVTISEHNPSRETHIQTAGFSVDDEAVLQLQQLIAATVSKDHVVVLGGSVPPGTAPQFMSQLVSLCVKSGAYVILDSSGEALLEGLKGRPHMIKPNISELQDIAPGADLSNETAIIASAKRALVDGPGRIVVSRGSLGLLMIDNPRGEIWSARVDIGKQNVTTSVGSGDAVVAAFAVKRLENDSPQETIRLAAACGAANLLNRPPGRFRTEDVEALLPQVIVTRLYV